jgi:hypothetical protein
MQLTVRVAGAELAGKLFTRTGQRLENPEPGLRLVADHLRKVESEQFASRGGRTGGWPELDPDTIRQKGSSEVLVATGELMRSLTRRGAAGSKEQITNEGLLFGTTLYYARFVSKRRPLVGLNSGDRREIAQQFMRWVFRGE